MKTFLLKIYTPYGKYLDAVVEEIVVPTEEYVLGILANHSPLVAKVRTGKLEIKRDGDKAVYAITEGLINVKKDGVTILVNTIERKDEIDIDRAKEAKRRAEERLKEPLNIDVERAQKALIRANNRIEIYEDN